MPDQFGTLDAFDATGQPTVTYDHPARAMDPQTSHDAAYDVVDREGPTGAAIRPGTHKALMLGAYVAAGVPLADFEAAQRCGLYRAHVCYWHRAGDLFKAGLLTECDETKINPDTGKARRMLIVNAEGYEAWRVLHGFRHPDAPRGEA